MKDTYFLQKEGQREFGIKELLFSDGKTRYQPVVKIKKSIKLNIGSETVEYISNTEWEKIGLTFYDSKSQAETEIENYKNNFIFPISSVIKQIV